MNIIFDHQVFVVQSHGGFTKYFVSLMRALRKISGVNANIIAPAHVNEYLLPSDNKYPVTFRMRRPKVGLYYRPFLVAPIFRLAAEFSRPSVIHETHFLLTGRHLPRAVPIVATCHDMIIERHANGSAASKSAILRKKLAFNRASAIICISENTREDLLSLYPHLEDRVKVVHHGVDQIEPAAIRLAQLPERYLLYVGMRGGYKNFLDAAKAFAAVSASDPGIVLVCFGGGAFTTEEHSAFSVFGVRRDAIIQVSGNERELARTYKNAIALIYPSLNEGFGMPLTEAMVQGCPVLCSDCSCFPEICGDAALYFNPESVESIHNAIMMIVRDEELRKSLATRGLSRSREFSWEICAAETYLVYKSAIERFRAERA